MEHFEITKQTEKKKFDRHWQFCVGSGHATLALRSDYYRQLKQTHEELGVERVRFHGIFGDDMHTMHKLSDIFPGVPEEAGGMEVSFRQCAAAYDNVLAAGVKPFVELSFMPGKLAKEGPLGGFFYKPNVNMPKDDEAWKEYIQKFVRFLIDRYGKEEVETWYFEVWNEPDLSMVFSSFSREEYFHFYEITARALKEVDEKLMVGGPATSNSRWVKAFVAFCEENGVPVDFVTTHQYAGDPIGGVTSQGGPEEAEEEERKEAEKMDGYKNQMEQIRQRLLQAPKDGVLPAYRAFFGDPFETKDTPENTFRHNAPIVKEQAKGLPVYYTEWNNCATFAAYGNDTRKVAAYDVKTALAIEGVVDGSSIWCFSDIFEEHHPFPEEFHGGFGMMTQSGIKKPVYHAMQMLAEVGEDRYVLPGALDGEIGMAAFSDETGVQVILFRQKMKNAPLPEAAAQVRIEMDMAPESVTVKKIDEEHGNPLKLWEAMGAPQTPTPVQVKELKEKSDLVEEPLSYTYENGSVSFQASLGVNDVWMVRIVF